MHSHDQISSPKANGASPEAPADIVRASVSSTWGILHFEAQMKVEIPANADPGFTPGVNHLGATFGLLTDPATAVSPIHFFGHHDH
jgi:hypothetical protein